MVYWDPVQRRQTRMNTSRSDEFFSVFPSHHVPDIPRFPGSNHYRRYRSISRAAEITTTRLSPIPTQRHVGNLPRSRAKDDSVFVYIGDSEGRRLVAPHDQLANILDLASDAVQFLVRLPGTRNRVCR